MPGDFSENWGRGTTQGVGEGAATRSSLRGGAAEPGTIVLQRHPVKLTGSGSPLRSVRNDGR